MIGGNVMGLRILVIVMIISWLYVPASQAAESQLMLLAELTHNLAPGQWLELPNTRIPLISSEELKAIQQQHGGQPIIGKTGPRSVIDAWNSAAFDGKRHQWYFFGGGHADYGGNEVYVFDFRSLAWTRLTSPSPLNGENQAQHGKDECLVPKTGPTPAHTYDGLSWNPATESMWLFQSRGYCGNGRVRRLEIIWEFVPGIAQWNKYPVPGLDPGFATTAWNPVTERIVLRNYEYGESAAGAMEIGARAKVYRRNNQRMGQGGGNMTYDPETGKMYILRPDGIYLQGLDGEVLPDTVRVQEYPNAALRDQIRLAGFAYHPPSKKFILWSGGTRTWSWDPQTGEFVELMNETDGPDSTQNRVFDKWVYLPELDVFAGYNNYSSGVWIYKANFTDPPKVSASTILQGSRNTLGSGGDPCATIKTACRLIVDSQDRNALRNALSALPEAGGVIILSPGNYVISKDNFLWPSGLKRLKIIGGYGPYSNTPARLVIDKDNPPSALIPWNATNGDLTIENLVIEGDGHSCVYTTPKLSQQAIDLVNVTFINCGKNPGNLLSKKVDDKRTSKSGKSIASPQNAIAGKSPPIKERLPSSGIPQDMECKQYKAPCVVLRETENSLAVKQAIQKIPLSGGTLVVMPGVYPVSKKGFLWLSKRRWLTIAGIVDDSGNPPHFRGIEGDAPNAIIPWGGTNGDLTIRNLEISGAGSDCIYTGSRSGKQIIRLYNVNIHHCGHHVWMNGWDKPNKWDNEVYAENSSFHHSGLTHVVYIDRIKKAEFKNIKVYAPKTLHAFKCVAIECNVFDSEISNGTLSGDWDKSTHWTTHERLVGYLGSAPMSLVACQKGRFERNTITFRFNAARGTGGTVITRQPRHDIYGCDQPLYNSDDFNDPEFWKQVVAGGVELPEVLNNKKFFTARWSNNTIRVFGERGLNTHLRIIANKGTAPVTSIEKGSTKLKYLSRPPGWVERSRDVVTGTCFMGITPNDVFDSSPWGNMSDEGVNPPKTRDRVYLIGENTCK